MKSLLLALAMLAGGGPATDFIYTCDGSPPVVVRFLENALDLRIGENEMQLAQGRSGSGARYTDGRVVFWIKGKSATLDTGDGRIRQCRVTDRG